MKNPFQCPDSPIKSLYKHSKSLSKQNRTSYRSPAQSYRDYQVKMIQQALKHNHIITKTSKNQDKNVINRERLHSKYFGNSFQGYSGSSYLSYEAEPSVNIYYEKKSEKKPLQIVQFNENENSQLQTLINVGTKRDIIHKTQMSYQSTAYMTAQPLSGFVPSSAVIPVTQTHQRKKSGERKCSINDDLQSQYQISTYSKNNRFGQSKKCMIDKVRQQYQESLKSQGSQEIRCTYYG